MVAVFAVFQQSGVVWLCPFGSAAAVVSTEPLWTSAAAIAALLCPALEDSPDLPAPA